MVYRCIDLPVYIQNFQILNQSSFLHFRFLANWTRKIWLSIRHSQQNYRLKFNFNYDVQSYLFRFLALNDMFQLLNTYATVLVLQKRPPVDLIIGKHIVLLLYILLYFKKVIFLTDFSQKLKKMG